MLSQASCSLFSHLNTRCSRIYKARTIAILSTLPAMATFFDPHGSSNILHSASGSYHKLKDDYLVEVESIPLTSRSDLSQDVPEDRKDSYDSVIPASDKFVVTTGWSLSLIILLFNGLVSICWGIALFIFSLGVVPISYELSEIGKEHPDVTNTIIAFVAAISTMHISYIIQQIPAHYSHCLLVDGFTLGHLRWMQGVQQLSIFTRFPDREGGGKITRFFTKKQIFWLATYFGIAFHTSSLVAILQPSKDFMLPLFFYGLQSQEIFYKGVLFDDPVPCGQNLANLTLGTDPFLSEDQQRIVDWYSFNIGTMLANYGGTFLSRSETRNRAFKASGYYQSKSTVTPRHVSEAGSIGRTATHMEPLGGSRTDSNRSQASYSMHLARRTTPIKVHQSGSPSSQTDRYLRW